MKQIVVESMRILFAEAVAAGTVSENEADIIHDALGAITELYSSRQNEAITHHVAFLTGKLPIEEFLRDVNGFEANCKFKPGRSLIATDELCDKGILNRTSTGVKLPSPPHHIFVRILPNWCTNMRQRNALFDLFNEFETLLGLAVVLPDREALGNEMAVRVGHEPCFVFSGTPAIFNPFEFVPGERNYTECFAESVKSAANTLHYVWNRTSVFSQVNKHRRESGLLEQDLLELYLRYFSPYASNPHVLPLVGQTNQFVSERESRVYISRSAVVKGIRIEGRVGPSVVVLTSVIRKLRTHIPEICDFVDLGDGVRVDLYSEDAMDQLLNFVSGSMDFLRLSGTAPEQAKKFVEDIFAASREIT